MDGSIRSDIADQVRAGVTAEVAAKAVISACPLADLADYVTPLVVEEARRAERHFARAVEEAATAPGRAGPSDLPRTRFRVRGPGCNGSWDETTWGAATKEQHLARMSWLRGQIGGLEVTFGRHSAAVALIERHGVACLDDIPGWSAVIGPPVASAPAPARPSGSARNRGTSVNAADGALVPV